MRIFYAFAALAAILSAPAAAETLDFDPADVVFNSQSDTYRFYTSGTHSIAVTGVVADGHITTDFLQIGTLVPDFYQNVLSFDVLGTGELRMQNFDKNGVPVVDFPVTIFTMTGVQQTISFDPALAGFILQLTADTEFRADNFVFASETAAPDYALPEPSTWALMILGFGAVGVSLRAKGSNRAKAVAA